VLGKGQRILYDLSLVVAQGELLGLMGPNGAGKSTIVNVIAGTMPLSEGRVLLNGTSVAHLSPAGRAHRGLARTFQNLELFPSMTVFDNVLCGLEAATPFSWSMRRAANLRKNHRERVREVLRDLDIDFLRDEEVHTLPYGTRKLVELARVLVRDPEVLLLDEPVAGLNRDEKAHFVALFSELLTSNRFSGILIEHDVATMKSLCPRLVVMDAGVKLAEGPFEMTLQLEEVINAYMGGVGEPYSTRNPAVD
jgi:branched-chain amino acid transport system ATP-binding protein